MATEAQIKTWIKGYPRNWNQLCQALMYQLAARFGTVKSTQPSAIAAYYVEKNAGRIRQGTAPPGSFVYWDIGTYGHVGYILNGGRCFMASSKIVEQWTIQDAGWNSVGGYGKTTGARYLGWSMQNGGNTVPFTPDSSSGGGTGGSEVPKTYSVQRSGNWTIAEGKTLRFQSPNGGVANLVGSVGTYSITLHVYGTGLEEGDILDLYLIWHDVATGKESSHYVERIHGSGDGSFKANVEFKRGVVAGTKGTTVVAELKAVKGNATVTMTGSDAYCWV